MTTTPLLAKAKADIDFVNELWNAANNYVLSPGRHVGSEAEEDNGVPFDEKMKLLITKLATQFEESALLEKKAVRIWRGLGLGFRC